MHGKRFARHAVDQQADAGGVFGEAGEGFGGDLAGVFAELFGEAFGVVAADLEGDDRADVAEDGVGGGLVQLALEKGVRNVPDPFSKAPVVKFWNSST